MHNRKVYLVARITYQRPNPAFCAIYGIDSAIYVLKLVSIEYGG